MLWRLLWEQHVIATGLSPILVLVWIWIWWNQHDRPHFCLRLATLHKMNLSTLALMCKTG